MDGYGGVVLNYTGLTEIEHSTITNNSAPTSQGSGMMSMGDTTEVYSSIISGNANTDADYYVDKDRRRIYNRQFASEGYNLIGDGNGQLRFFFATGDQRGVSDPGLEALNLNGGSTKTHALQATSPALNAGSPTTECPPPAIDQRGVARPQEGTCDIGSFERDLTAPEAPVITSPAEGSLKPGSFSVTGTAEANATVELFEGTESAGQVGQHCSSSGSGATTPAWCNSLSP